MMHEDAWSIPEKKLLPQVQEAVVEVVRSIDLKGYIISERRVMKANSRVPQDIFIQLQSDNYEISSKNKYIFKK